MDAEKIYSLLFNLYAEQENLKIEYEVDNSFFSTRVPQFFEFPSDCFIVDHYSTPPKKVYISMIT